MKNPMNWILPILLFLAGLAAASFTGYSKNDKDVNSRVTAVEVQQKNDGESIHRIEGKVDRVDGKIDRVNEKIDNLLKR